MQSYVVIDIETCPNNLDAYFSLEEQQQKELINPIDSKIVAIGLRHNGKNNTYQGEEKQILEDFWRDLKEIMQKSPLTQLVGFSIIHFDMPFITARSFIHGVEIHPFLIKSIIDLREKINAYRYGKTRGKLKEYAELLGLTVLGVDGGDIAQLCKDNDHGTINKYLKNDLEITDSLYQRAVQTKIVDIKRW